MGLGLMGSAIAERLGRDGFGVLGFDIRHDRLEAARHHGVQAASGVQEIARQCRRIVLSLYDSTNVESVLQEMHPALQAGQILLDTTTGDAERAKAAGQRLLTTGVTYLDATLSGNRDQLLLGETTLMVGGPQRGFEACQDLFRCLAKRAFHVGDCGAGTKMKLVTNLVLGLNRAALAEGLVLAQALGFNSADALAVLSESPAYSRIMESKGPKMVRGDFTPQARLSQHLKDVRLMIEAGEKAGLRMPLSRAHQQVLEQGLAAGLGALDNAAIIQVLGQKSRVPHT